VNHEHGCGEVQSRGSGPVEMANEHHKAKKTTEDIFGDTVQELSALGQKPC
jgi:hypothetical protein